MNNMNVCHGHASNNMNYNWLTQPDSWTGYLECRKYDHDDGLGLGIFDPFANTYVLNNGPQKTTLTPNTYNTDSFWASAAMCPAYNEYTA
jgi:hypothetical protein